MNWSHTEHGCAIAEFDDLYGQRCSIQRSSVAGMDAIWLGVDVDFRGTAVNKRMHLNRAQVQELVGYLQHFVDTGLLPGEDPK